MIELKDISKSYTEGFLFRKKINVLKKINMKISKGNSVGLIGNSGSGKSTISNLICGMEKYDSGEIFFEGKKVISGEKRNEISVIFQNPKSSFEPRATMYKNLKEVMDIDVKYDIQEKNRLIRDYTNLVGLNENLLSRNINEISGGEAQRFSIVRALLKEAKFLILDEATSMLDISTQAQILKLLKKLQIERNLTYLFISHDLDIARIFCNYIFVLNNGVIVEEGEIKDIFENPKNSYTKDLIRIFNKLNI